MGLPPPLLCGGMADRLIALALEAGRDGSRQGPPRPRGFESHSLRSMVPSVWKRLALVRTGTDRDPGVTQGRADGIFLFGSSDGLCFQRIPAICSCQFRS